MDFEDDVSEITISGLLMANEWDDDDDIVNFEECKINLDAK